jgi:Cu/Ag efflux protein CusF
MIPRTVLRSRASIIAASLIASSLVASLVTSLVASPCFAQDAASAPTPPAIDAGAIAQVQARVIGIDAASNSVTLQGPRGRVVDVAVNPEVGNVGKLQIGDTLNIEYQNALLVRATKVASNGIRERVDESATIPASGGVTATARRVQVLATIQKVDRKARTVTLRGPTRTETFQVGHDVSLDGLKAGDSVRAEFVSATAVQVLRNGAPIK